MKKLCLFLAAFITLSSVFADEYIVSKIHGKDAFRYQDLEIPLKYDDKKDIFFLDRTIISDSSYFMFTRKQLEKMRETVQKAIEWKNTAIENDVSIEKALPDMGISVPVTWKRGGSCYTGKKNLTFEFIFKSEKVFRSEPPVTILTITSDVTAAKEYEFVHAGFADMIFLGSDIDDLAKSISDETISTAISNHSANVRKEKQKSDLFK